MGSPSTLQWAAEGGRQVPRESIMLNVESTQKGASSGADEGRRIFCQEAKALIRAPTLGRTTTKVIGQSTVLAVWRQESNAAIQVQHWGHLQQPLRWKTGSTAIARSHHWRKLEPMDILLSIQDLRSEGTTQTQKMEGRKWTWQS